MKLLGSTENKITKVENSENVNRLEINKILLLHRNIFKNYQQLSTVLHTFVPNKLFDQFLEISLTSFVVLKTFILDFPHYCFLIKILNHSI